MHYSGHRVKPWKLLWEAHDSKRESESKLLVASVEELSALTAQHRKDGDGTRLDVYNGRARLWAAMLEWLDQFAEAADALKSTADVDVVELVMAQQEAEMQQLSAHSDPGDGNWSWHPSS